MKLLILSNSTFFHNVFQSFFLRCVKMSIYGEKDSDSSELESFVDDKLKVGHGWGLSMMV